MGNKYIKWGAWIVGVIFMGAISTAVYDRLLSPLINIIFRLSIFIYTLGSSNLNNAIYQETAKGFHELISLKLLNYFLAAFIALILSTLITILYRAMQANIFPKYKPKQGLRSLLTHIIFPLYSIFVIIFLTISLSADVYTNKAITHFNQCISICSPYISNEQITLYKSYFAQMNSKGDYINLINNLKKIADKNTLTLPKFEVW